MSASPIATNIGLEEVVGSLLTGASMILTIHSLSRMIFLRRTGSKYHLFPVINVAQFINQLCIFFLITTAFNTISFRSALWLNVINNFAYFVTKPTTMYLAYLRCSAVYPKFKKFAWLHYFLIVSRGVELFGIVVINIIQNNDCDGSVAKGTKCENLAIAWTFRDAGAPIFRFYYILCEGIFYVTLFRTLKGMSQGKNLQLIQYRRLQTTLFTVDLALLIFMSIYRIFGIFDKDLPTYVYYELLSSTLTIFNLTEFGLNIRILFNTVTDAKSASQSGSDSPSKLEMGSIHHSTEQNPVASTTLANGISGNMNVRSAENSPHSATRYSSTSPLTSFAAETGYNNDFDPYSRTQPFSTVSSSFHRPSSPRVTRPSSPLHGEHNDYLPYNASAGTRESVSRQDKYIITPANFQRQAQSGFYEGVTSNAEADASPSADERRSSGNGGISRPTRALAPPERSAARR
ncbi:hypothetical protein BC939DRAFT_461126 [Gamsiella multidivaricata]|uniref:uncharacterized protein n=1 Tax=Gamsiella multidivaricata TaxID=101098 RepID=UPI0022203C00|nr:uncharacterized protein BC939DRAFT_461126 [Gamsiella multidivaricata]KAG0367988.1 hypothetical protein BGZ54_002886 [Gamsiella multidivaricata]KAI7819088.1 hypothetical protein BC939DRAFT_461126 [Gamsiella multidivaricata]